MTHCGVLSSSIGRLFFSILLTSILLVGYKKAQGDEKRTSLSYRVPIDLPVSLSGSYGELRATHFHAGVDLRVGGVSGAPLFAAEEGYVSRVSVSPGGYGNAIYIDHPDGKTTLYGHMHEFVPKIAKWVREQQYSKESFSINLYPEPELFPIKRGEVIGKAGNSGSSGGPHLHFEVRETKTQLPLNPIREAGINVTDNIPPQIQKVNIYSISGVASLPQREIIYSLKESVQNVLTVTDTFYVAVLGIDKQNNTVAKLAVAKYSYFLDGEKIFSFVPDNIPFDQGRYINSVVEYPEKQENGYSMIKSWVEPGGGIKSNIDAINDGLFILRDDQVHNLRIELSDEHGNVAERSFKIKRGASYKPGILSDTLRVKSGVIMPWFLPNRFERDDIKVTIPPGSLYSSIFFEADSENVNGSKVWSIHTNKTPLHNSGRVSLRANVPDSLSTKALIAMVNERGGLTSIGGRYNDGWIDASIGSLGAFTVALDTLMPRVLPSFKDGANLAGRSYIRFTVSDDLSGIAEYRVTIDDKWILAAYDPKNRRVEVELRSDKITKGERHNIIVSVTDNSGNTNNFKSSFIW
ncbi:MAG: M23 family metallopeptidase [Bacteroidales bacterium]|nr:M23 family metallopeptidase [Bacteroidales bacterium]